MRDTRKRVYKKALSGDSEELILNVFEAIDGDVSN
jgi:hypothetical protein